MGDTNNKALIPHVTRAHFLELNFSFLSQQESKKILKNHKMPFNLFGKKEQKVDAQTAITKLRDSEEMLEKKSKHLEAQIDKELQSAKQHGTKNKRAALNALKRKKRLEAQLKVG